MPNPNPIQRFKIYTMAALACVAPAGATQAQDHWPRFRGPDATGTVEDDPRLPLTWSKTENVAWTTEIPGWGWSSPAIWGDHVFVTTVVSDQEYENPQAGLYRGRGRQELPDGEHQWLVYALDATTGDIQWKRVASKGPAVAPRHPKNTYASETPATDGKRVFALFGDLGLFCYDFEGNLVWSQPIEARETLYDYGSAASPIVHETLVIYVYDNQEASYIAAHDTETGEQIWKKERDEPSAWATPFVWETESRTEIVTAGKNRIRSYDLSGNVIWSMDGRMSNLTIPSPFAANGLLYVNSGYFQDRRKPAWAIRPGATGDITIPEGETTGEFVQWHRPRIGTYNTSPLVYGDLHYTSYDRGMISVHNALNGEEIYDRERFPRLTSFTASPWAYNGHIFCLAENGKTFALEAGPEFNIVQTNDLEELCIATPSIANGRLYIRTSTRVHALTESQPIQ